MVWFTFLIDNNLRKKMILDPDSATSVALTIDLQVADRWQIYRRLQELGIPCQCRAHQPLQVEVQSGLALVQLWSVVRQFDASRGENVARLDRCWRLAGRGAR
jgi:hypothetical protein